MVRVNVPLAHRETLAAAGADNVIREDRLL
jgi:hypothetical protein